MDELDCTTSIRLTVCQLVPLPYMLYYILQMVSKMRALFGLIGHFRLNASVDDYDQRFEAGAIHLQTLIIMSPPLPSSRRSKYGIIWKQHYL